MIRDVSIIGVGMTPMDTRDQSVQKLASDAATAALADAGVSPNQVGLVLVGNALGGRLLEQGCIRGQAWLREVGLGSAGLVNVDNSCAGGSTALHMGFNAAVAGESPVLVVGVEKMWTGDRWATLAGIEDGLPAYERPELHAALGNDSGSILMGLNSTWVRRQGPRARDVGAADSGHGRQVPALRLTQSPGAIPHAGDGRRGTRLPHRGRPPEEARCAPRSPTARRPQC